MAAIDTSDTPKALDGFRADRAYLGADHVRNERRTWLVTGICGATLAVLAVGGAITGSIALLANAVHMAAHVAALLVAAGAYALARHHAQNPMFAFGAGKVGYLAGFANAMIMAVTAALIAVESIGRLFDPKAVDYHGALPIAAAGLTVNLVCIWLLRPTRSAAARNDPDGDLNLTAAHLHMTADAIVSVLSLAAIWVGKRFGWGFADPLAGLLAALLVAQFALRLIRRAGVALLDINPAAELTEEVCARLTAEGETLEDLHLWRLGPGHHAVIAVLSGKRLQTPDEYRTRLAGLSGLSHVTIELHPPGMGGDHRGHSHG